MTLATSRSFKTFREQIWSALWLLELLAAYTPKDWAGEVAWVARRKWNDRLSLDKKRFSKYNTTSAVVSPAAE